MNDSMQTPSETIPKTLTPLAEFLADAHSTAAGGTSSDESEQLSALLERVGAFDLGSMSRIVVTGQDRVRWLNGMLTNNVQALEEGRGNYNFFLNAQGRIQGDGYVYRHGERLLLHTSQSQTQKLLDHLDHFIIMDDVEMKPSPHLTALGVAGPGAVDLLRKLGNPEPNFAPLSLIDVEIGSVKVTLIRSDSLITPRYELWFERHHVGALWQALLDAGATACDAEAVEKLRILDGIPAYGIDLHDRDLPQETGQTRALNFSKGCYLGQEIVERIRSRGNVHRVFHNMKLTGSVPNLPAELRVNGKAIGQITSAASITIGETTHHLALGFLRTEILTSAARIEYDGGIAIPIDKKPGAEFGPLK